MICSEEAEEERRDKLQNEKILAQIAGFADGNCSEQYGMYWVPGGALSADFFQ